MPQLAIGDLKPAIVTNIAAVLRRNVCIFRVGPAVASVTAGGVVNGTVRDVEQPLPAVQSGLLPFGNVEDGQGHRRWRGADSAAVKSSRAARLWALTTASQ